MHADQEGGQRDEGKRRGQESRQESTVWSTVSITHTVCRKRERERETRDEDEQDEERATRAIGVEERDTAAAASGIRHYGETGQAMSVSPTERQHRLPVSSDS